MIRPFEPTISAPSVERSSLRTAIPNEQKLPDLSKDEHKVINQNFDFKQQYVQYTSQGEQKTQIHAKGRVLDLRG
ncbi:MAG: hypothetical protein EBR32_01900 [Bacteroidetes bacterium]|nr:hypothetical protein [Bacteroidota bacterium]